MIKRVVLIGLLLVTLASTLLFSATPPTIAQDDPEPTETPIVEDIGEGDIHISFWNGLTGSDGVTLNEMLAEFAAENPDISVTVEMIVWATLYQKLQTAFVAGEEPDVFLLHASEIPMFGYYGVLRDLGDQYTSGGGWLPDDDLSATTLSGMKFDDVLYGIPLDNHGRGLWINVDMFEAAGLSTDPADAPTTYEGWVELFQKVTLDANGNNALSPDFDPENVVQWGYAVSEWPEVNFIAGVAQEGGSWLSEDGQTAQVNSPEAIAALQKQVDLVYEYHVSPPQAGHDSWQAFGAGTLAVLPTGTWFRNQAELFTDINSTHWPNWQFGSEPAAWFGAHTFMIPTSLEGEKLDAVLRMIQWVSENQVIWASSGQVPARLSAQAALDPETYPSNIYLGQTFTDYGVIDPSSVVYQELMAIMLQELSAALNGLKSVEEALNDMNNLMQEAIDRA